MRKLKAKDIACRLPSALAGLEEEHTSIELAEITGQAENCMLCVDECNEKGEIVLRYCGQTFLVSVREQRK